MDDGALDFVEMTSVPYSLQSETAMTAMYADRIPTASTVRLGAVRVGSGLSISDDGVLSVLHVDPSLPVEIQTKVDTPVSELKAGEGLLLSGTTFSIGNEVVTSSYHSDVVIRGGVSATRFVGDGSGLTNISFNKLSITKADVVGLGIPADYIDTNTTYNAGTGLSLNGTTFSIENNGGSLSNVTPVDNSVTSAKIAAGAVSNLAISDTAGSGLSLSGTTFSIENNGGSLSNVTPVDNSVTSEKIFDGTITNADISTSAAIPFSKLFITKADVVGLGIPASDTDTVYTAGTGLSLSGTTFAIGGTVVTSNYT